MGQATYTMPDGSVNRRWRIKTTKGEFVTWAADKSAAHAKAAAKGYVVCKVVQASSMVEEKCRRR